MYSSISTETLCEHYEQLYAGLVAHTLDGRGYTDQILDPSLAPINRSTTFAGIAFPAVVRANRVSTTTNRSVVFWR